MHAEVVIPKAGCLTDLDFPRGEHGEHGRKHCKYEHCKAIKKVTRSLILCLAQNVHCFPQRSLSSERENYFILCLLFHTGRVNSEENTDETDRIF